MGIRRFVAVAATAAALVGALAPAGAEHESESERYTFGTGDLVADCAGNSGSVCFDLVEDAIKFSLVIQDDTGLPVGAAWQLLDRVDLLEGEVLAEGSFCASKPDVPIVANARALVVYIDGPLFGPQDCLLSGVQSPGVGTEGKVTVTFEYP